MDRDGGRIFAEIKPWKQHAYKGEIYASRNVSVHRPTLLATRHWTPLLLIFSGLFIAEIGYISHSLGVSAGAILVHIIDLVDSLVLRVHLGCSPMTVHCSHRPERPGPGRTQCRFHFNLELVRWGRHGIINSEKAVRLIITTERNLLTVLDIINNSVPRELT